MTSSPPSSSDNPQPLVVLGAGLMRTGTYSLMVALERLLGGKCYHMTYVFKNPEDINFWRSALDKDPSDAEWRHFFKDCRAAVDFPAMVFYRRLMEVYPNAKVILTLREPHSWYRSVSNTIRKQIDARKEACESGPMRHFPAMGAAMSARMLGEVDLDDEVAMVNAFQRHTESVKSFVPKDKLLVFEAKEGWEPLCRFLDLPLPDEPYPLTNTTEEFLARYVNKAKE